MAFVVTSGQLASVAKTSPYTVPPMGRSVALSATLTQTYEQLWIAQPAVRAVTGFLARNIAQLGLDPYRRVSATDREKATNHPLWRLLERPLDASVGGKLTKYRLINNLVHELCIYDNAYWLKLRGDGGGLGLLPVPARMVTPQGDNAFLPTGYKVKGPRGEQEFGPDALVHFHGYNPGDPRFGVSPMETLRQVLAEEYAATTYRAQMWRNGARIAGYITRPKDAGKWGPGARERFRTEWQGQYTGDGLEVGGTPILEDGMKFEPATVTPRDAQYVEARELTRKEVAVAYYVPPVMLGMMEGATYSNVSEYHKSLYQDTLGPWLTQISQDIECQLLDDLEPGAALAGTMYVEFNLKEKLRGSFEEQAKALQSAVGGPWMTRDEARAMHNLPHIDGAEQLIVPLNVTEGGLASPNDTAPDEPDNEESNKAAIVGVLCQHFTRQAASIASKLGAGAVEVEDVFDAQRWNVELASDLARIGVDGPVTAINASVREGVASALATDDPRQALTDLFASYANHYAASLARSIGS